MNKFPGQSMCTKCGIQKMSINGQEKCANCDIPKPEPSGVVNKISDPGEEEINRLLARKGIVVPGLKVHPTPKTTVKSVPMPSNLTDEPTFESKIQHALVIMKSLTMPDDVKQFRKINKIIRDLKSLLPEK